MAAYERIRADLRGRIASGLLVPGDRLPAEAELARHYGVTRMTVRHAIDHLLNQGLVQRKWGVGTFIAEPRPAHRSFNRLQGFAEEMATGDRILTTKVIQQEELGVAPPEIREALELAEGAPVVHLERIRLLDERPVALQHSWVPFGVCPSLGRQPLVGGSLYATLEAVPGVELCSAEQTVTAVAARRSEAAVLGVARGAPLLRYERRTSDARGRIVEFARSWTVPELPIVMRLTRRADGEGAL